MFHYENEPKKKNEHIYKHHYADLPGKLLLELKPIVYIIKCVP